MRCIIWTVIQEEKGDVVALLQVLLAAFEPPTIEQAEAWLDSGGPSTVLACLSKLGSLFRVDKNKRVHSFHKSIYDWLVDSDAAGDFWTDAREGHAHIAHVLRQQASQLVSAHAGMLRKGRTKGVSPSI